MRSTVDVDADALEAVSSLKSMNTIPEAAAFFRVDPRTIRDWARRGRLKVFRTAGGGSGRVLVTKAEIARALSSMRQRCAFDAE